MGSRMKVSVIFSSFLITVLLVVGAVLGKSEEKEGAYRSLAVYTEVLARIKSDYVEEPDIPKVTEGALQGLVEYLDPQSSYLSAEQYGEYLKSLKNEDGGTGLATGMVVHKRVNYTTVMAVLPGSAADEVGIQAGDLIEAVDEMSTRVMPPAYLLSKLSGEPGVRVSVMIRPVNNYDSPKEYELRRSAVRLPDVKSEMLKGNIGSITAMALTAKHVQQIAAAIKSLESSGAEKLIVDVRSSLIGEISDGIQLANLFLDSGTIASAKGQKYAEKIYSADAESTVTALPVAFIIDRPTAGAAEVAAAAILQNSRGVVVGESSYGLAAIQETIELDDGAALLLSVAKYYGPDGKAIHDEGLEPNHLVAPRDLRKFREFQRGGPALNEPDRPKVIEPALEDTGDPFIKKAIEVLNG
jgi:carboxyl-terminal processing protease